MKLPKPQTEAKISLERCLATRRSVRSFAGEPLTVTELAQLLWAGQGITDRTGLRAAPSAGALYPLELYAVVADVTHLEPGTYHYAPRGNELSGVLEGDRLTPLAMAAGQDWIASAAAAIVVAAVFTRTTGKYGSRGVMYVHMEAGHAAENIHLQAVALGLGGTVVGAFNDEKVKDAAGLGGDLHPLCLVPVGRP